MNLLDKALSGSVGGVSLSGEEELYGILGIVYNLCQPVEVAEEEVCALVGSKAACETDDEGVGVDLVEQAYHACGIALVLQPVVAEAVTDVVYQLVLQGHTGFPYFLVAYLIDVLPDALVALVLDVLLAEVFLVECLPLVCAPGGVVYAVGDVAYVAFVGVHIVDLLVLIVRENLMFAVRLFGHVSGPDGCEHALAHLSVEPAYAIHFLAGLAKEGRHAEALALVAGVLTAESHKVVPADTQFLSVVSEVLAGKSFVEIVVSGGHGSVYGIEAAGAYEFEGFAEVESALYVVGQALEVGKGSMALVAVVYIHLDAELLQSEHTADTEEVLLLHAVFPVTAIECVGDALVEFGIHFVVGVEEVEGNASYVDLPYKSMYGEGVEGNVNDHLLALAVEDALDGHAVEILRFVFCNLLSVHREGLCEVTVTIEETYGSHVNVGVRSLLYIVAGKDAETTGVDLHVVIHTILHAEIGYAGTVGALGLVHIVAELLVDAVHASHQVLVGAHHLQTLVADAVQQFNGVLLHFAPDFGVEALEKFKGFLVPAEPEVVSHFIEGFQHCGDVTSYGHSAPLGLIGICDIDHLIFMKI